MKTKKLFALIVTMLFSLVLALAGCQGGNETEKVTVGFDLNFRTIVDDPENIEVTPGEAYGELPAVEVENEGYTFVGWNTKANGKGDNITSESIVSETKGDHTLYAIWQGKTYTVSYELNGGTVNGATTLPTQTVTFGNIYGAMVIPSDPEKPLSEFLGWYLNPEGNGAPVSYSSDVRTAKDHTLYAIYRDLREVYDFTTADQINDFVNVDHAGMEIVEDENGNYLKLTPINFEAGTPAADLYSILMLKTPLKAGKVVEVDCEVVGEIVDAWGFWSWGAVSTGDIQFDGQKVTKWETPELWNEGKFTSYTEITENCAGLRIQFRYVGNADAYWKITGIRIKDAGDVTPPVIEERTEFDFTTANQINYFDKAENVTYSIVEDENGNYLKVDGVEGSSNILMFKRALTAGMKVTVDVEYVGENVAFEAGQITFLAYTANANGDADGKTTSVIGNASWDGGWDCAKTRLVTEITADCAGLRLQFVFNNEENAYFKITNIRIYAEGEEVEQLPTEPVEPDPIIPDEPVVNTRTEYDFTTEEQINDFGKEKNVSYEIVDGYLKVVGTAGSESILVLSRELTAGMKVTVDVEYVGTNLAYAGGNQITFLAYTANAAGDADGKTTAVMGNANWDGGWDCSKVRLVVEITEDCAGIRMQLVMNGDEGAYFKITNIKLYAEGEEVEQLPVVPDEPIVPDEPVVNTRTEYDFTTEDQINDFGKEKNVSYEIVDGYLKVVGTAGSESILVLSRELTAGMKVTVDVEYVGTNLAYAGGNQITFLAYTANAAGDADGKTTSVIGNASWDGGWDCSKVRLVVEITEDCAGIRMQFVMNSDEGAYFKITNIKLYAEGEEVEQLPVVPDEPIVPDEPVVNTRTEYDFTTADQINDFGKEKNVSYEIVDGYLKVVGTAGSESILVLSRELTAGQSVEIDVEYVANDVTFVNGVNQVTFLGYTANAAGDADGKTTAVIGSAPWDGGWNCAKTTVSVAVTQDCAGIRMQFVMNSEVGAYFKITAIRIVDAQ